MPDDPRPLDPIPRVPSEAPTLEYETPAAQVSELDLRAAAIAGAVGGLCVVGLVAVALFYAPFIAIVMGVVVALVAAARSPRNEFRAGLIANVFGMMSAAIAAGILSFAFVHDQGERGVLFGFVMISCVPLFLGSPIGSLLSWLDNRSRHGAAKQGDERGF